MRSGILGILLGWKESLLLFVPTAGKAVSFYPCASRQRVAHGVNSIENLLDQSCEQLLPASGLGGAAPAVAMRCVLPRGEPGLDSSMTGPGSLKGLGQKANGKQNGGQWQKKKALR